MNPRVVGEADALRVLGQPMEREYALVDLLRRPDVTYNTLMTLPGAGPSVNDVQVAEQVEIQAKYQGYIERQQVEISRSAQQENTRLPQDIDYSKIAGLSIEAQQKLAKHQPETLGQAARISGITPATISVLMVYAKRGFTGQRKTA